MAEAIATRSSRGHRTICLPIPEGAYRQAINDPRSFDVSSTTVSDRRPNCSRQISRPVIN
jgi:hypothetical protein